MKGERADKPVPRRLKNAPGIRGHFRAMIDMERPTGYFAEANGGNMAASGADVALMYIRQQVSK